MSGPTPTVSDIAAREDLAALLADLRDIPSIELKITVDRGQMMALRTMKLDVLTGVLRECCFYDTPALDLFNAGVIVRTRRTQGRDDDTVVKLRPAGPKDLPADVLASPDLKIEMDVTPRSYVISSSLRALRPAGAVWKMYEGAKKLEKLFTKEQRAFFADHAPDGIGWSDLVRLGPVAVVLLKARPEGFPGKLTFEMWHYPGELPLVELSTKTTRQGLLDVVPAARGFFAEHGLKPSAKSAQEPKTRKALEFFASQYA